ncbi:hypothetical protein EDB81DRAFT_69927 [Dactylonectria macrodidyma]|uniref:Uncharacterized protein n=1 Tax=Dactylonectria macrodidyma TaxID=307937 RepID=A0A9P9J0S1_9HYPO|nr:hypothetical protein EDB81DRAFT_69927 [Dactylonectria macrodidyma]
MSDHPCEIHDRTVIQDEGSHCFPNSKRRFRKCNRRDRRRSRRKERKRNTRQNGDQSPRSDAHDNQLKHFNGIYEVHESHGNYQWTALPENQLKHILEDENKSWIEVKGGEFTEQTLFQRFREATPNASRGTIQEVEEVSSFCGSQTLQDLELGSRRIPSTETFLDDRTIDDCRSDGQRHPGPLSVRQQYLELKKPRFTFCDLHGTKDQDTVTANSNQEQLGPRQNADRRVIFHTNLNPWGAMALVSTASRLQAPKVYALINRHLMFESFISVRNTGSKKFPFYEFEFALPCYAWRTVMSDRKPDDAKSRGRKKPLRNVQDLSFLSIKRPSSGDASLTDYLCEAGTSVLISAIDSRRYIAYALVDSYFDDEDERESAKAYFDYPDIDSDVDDEEDDDSYLEHDVLHSDPLTRGEFDANMPSLDPWRYFWATLKARIEVVEGEWRTVAKNAENRIKTYIDSAPLDLGPLSCISFEDHCAWIRQTKSLLGRLIKTLEGLIEDWKRFQRHETFSKDVVARELSDVHESFQVLEKCVWKLKCLQKDCNDFRDVVTLYMSAEANRGSEIQAGVAKFSVTVAIVMLVFHGPVSLSSGIYSMQADAIPHFLGPTKLSFMALTGSLVGAVFLFSLLIHFRHIGLAMWRACFRFETSTKRENHSISTDE